MENQNHLRLQVKDLASSHVANAKTIFIVFFVFLKSEEKKWMVIII